MCEAVEVDGAVGNAVGGAVDGVVGTEQKPFISNSMKGLLVHGDHF